MTDAKDPPIDEPGYTQGVTVIDIGDIRVARGLTRRPHSACSHHHMVYDQRERRIWCRDCERDVEPFDAFTALIGNCDDFLQMVERKAAEVAEARDHSLHLIAARNLEKIWRSRRMAPCCPHCDRGLLPDDFKITPACTSAEIERQRRKREKAKP
ncbi:hypothetical protein [Maricaulis sp.]|uniref:hypothetical protein n=1 Tax=Maricaulis sp. TaxID=1486257 RepID=UPI003A94FFC6